jgi:hypothetical protein
MAQGGAAVFFVLKWKQKTAHRCSSRYEIRPMSALIQKDDRWEPVETNLNFIAAKSLRDRLEAQEERA